MRRLSAEQLLAYVEEEEQRRQPPSPAESLLSYRSENFKDQPLPTKPVTSPQFIINATAYDGDKTPRRSRVSLDSGAETNLVDDFYARAMNFQKVEAPIPSTPRAVQDLPIQLGPAYRVRWAARDSWGQIRNMETIFYGVNDPSINLLLGMPGMEAGGIATFTAAREWRWSIQADRFEVLSQRKFLLKMRLDTSALRQSARITWSMPNANVGVRYTPPD